MYELFDYIKLFIIKSENTERIIYYVYIYIFREQKHLFNTITCPKSILKEW